MHSLQSDMPFKKLLLWGDWISRLVGPNMASKFQVAVYYCSHLNRGRQCNFYVITLVTTTGIRGKVINVSTLVLNSAWIVDSGTTDHMTFDVRQISKLNPTPKIVSPQPMVILPQLLGKGYHNLLTLYILILY